MTKKIRLGVNLDHVATLRQIRGAKTSYPNILEFVKTCEKIGVDQITIHLREDRRHIQEADLKNILNIAHIPINLEMAATPEMLKIALKYKPAFICLVPEKRQELTTEGGLDVQMKKKFISELIDKLYPSTKISTFIGPVQKQVKASCDVGAFACEFHTGHWCLYKGTKKENEWKRLVQSAQYCHELGLNVHAGHGLDYTSTREIKKLPYLEEVNIGHFLICESLRVGFAKSVSKMIEILK